MSLQIFCLLLSALNSAAYTGHYYYAFCIRTKNSLYLSEDLSPWFAGEDGKVNAIATIGSVRE